MEIVKFPMTIIINFRILILCIFFKRDGSWDLITTMSCNCNSLNNVVFNFGAHNYT